MANIRTIPRMTRQIIKAKPSKDGSYRIRVDKELVDVLEELAHKIDDYSYNAIDGLSVKQVSKILALKIREFKLV